MSSEDRTNEGSTLALERIVSEFLSAWDEGNQPDLNDYLEKVPAATRDELFSHLIAIDLSQRRKRGEIPSPTEYLRRFPSDQPTISAAFNAIQDTMGPGTQHDGSCGSIDVEIAVGQKLGKYEIRSVLGIGGMGIVFGAYDPVIRRDVAIKLLSSKHSTDSTALTRLLQEAQTAGSIHHPGIVGVYDVLEEDDSYFVVMEKVDGENLSDILKTSEKGYLDWKLATRIAIDCCEALAAAHERGMIHRDIKPQNIMLTVQSRAKLLDFGLAKSEHSGETALTQEGMILGTPDFMSPEQCSAESISTLSDLYSLGATYYALLTGHPPFESQGSQLKVMFAHCNRPFPKLQRPDLPEGCDAIIQRATQKRPEDRFQSATEFQRELEGLLHHPTPAPLPAQSAVQPERTMSGRRKLLLGLAASAVSIPPIALLWPVITGGNSSSGSGDDVNPLLAANRKVPPFRGVTPDSIDLGTTTAFNGPNEELGRNMVIGMRTYFSSVNAKGGIHGRKINLTVLDDRYDPDKALENMVQLYDERGVFATIGNVGTPTAKVTARYASENRYLFFAPFTGASLLREDPPDRYIFNFRASYGDETAALVRYFVDVLRIPPQEIAVFAQNDSYGDDGFAGVARAMRKYGVRQEDLLRVGYDRNQLDIEKAVTTLLDSQRPIQAIVMVPTYKVAARFVKRVRMDRPGMFFGAVSFVGSEALAEEFREIGLPYGEGVIVTQVVPPFSSNATGVIEYRHLLEQYFPEYIPGFVSLEGFIAAAIFSEGLRRAGAELTTETMIDALHTINQFDLGIGPLISFSPSRHQASDRVWGTRLNENGDFETLDLET